ncbi:MAG TPA: SelB C-terminal domain-containing protein, partial [Armatimonadota bacterium]
EADRIRRTLEDAGFNPPDLSELLGSSPLPQLVLKELLDLLVYRKELVKVANDLYFHRTAIDTAERLLRDYFSANQSITVSQFRDLTKSSRKYALPILEYFDSCKLTRRIADARVLLKV